VQGVQVFQFNEINPAFLVEPMRNFDPAVLVVEIARITRGKNHMVKNGLHLHLIAAGPAAVIVFFPRLENLTRPALKAVLQMCEPVEIVAGRGKIMSPEKIPRQLDFRVPDCRSAMDPLLQSFHQFPDLPFAFFGSHAGD
jgi:hypothetical protein